ncbi:erythromycin esterase family protein [Sphingobacterium thalpophilum]|uniref:Erythromycin esterase family protein n=1 Tax=Sphingobacterium thalpophilum TaxID=259 RepID=A0ABV4HE57_9SPHI
MLSKLKLIIFSFLNWLLLSIYGFSAGAQIDQENISRFQVDNGREINETYHKFCILEKKTDGKKNKLIIVQDKRYKFNKEVSKLTIIKKIFIPSLTRSDTLCVSTNIKNNTSGILTLKIQKLDANENLIEERIETFGQGEEDTKLIFSHKGTGMLNICVDFQGVIREDQSISIDDIELEINNKNLSQLFPHYMIPPTLDNNLVLPLNAHTLLSSFNKKEHPLFRAKIIALGESTHGSKSISDLRYSFVKELIIQNKSNVVLLEMPVNIGFIFEAYVQSYFSDTTKLVQQYANLSYDGESLISFSKWLRNYNKSSTSKVHLFGIDNNINAGDEIPLMDIHKEILGEHRALPYLRLLNKRELSTQRSLAIEDNILQKKMGNMGFKIYLSVLEQKQVYSHQDRFFERDRQMFQRVRQIDSLFNPKNRSIIILAHSAHLKKNLSYECKPEKMLGYYLYDYYRGRFYNMTFTFGSGTYLQDDLGAGQWVVDSLNYRPVRSFEYYAFETKKDLIFYPTDKMVNMLIPILKINRNGKSRSNFELCSPKRNFNAFVFLRRSQVSKNYDAQAAYYSLKLFTQKASYYKILLQ